MQVPFVDLKKQYAGIQKDIDHALRLVFENSAFAYDDTIYQFEVNFAQYLHAAHCIACGNCTDALEIILRSMNIGKGDEVLVPANGWLSAAEAVCLVGGKPVFVDNHPDYYNMDPQLLHDKISDRAKAIILIHLYGLPANMDAILQIARTHGLKVIEDCAQAHGAIYQGKKAGSMGDAAAFSFYPTKNLGAYGDAGAIITNNKDIAEKCRMMANHGQLARNQHLLLGRNSRMDSLQAAVLRTKLPYLESWNERRRKNAQLYTEILKDTPLILPKVPENITAVFHLFVVRIKNRNRIMQKLKETGIGTGIHYPTPLPLMPVFSHLKCKAGDYPVACTQADALLSLPIYPELTEDQILYVGENLKKLVCQYA
jgi:dTDP-4-amino-4,6-dideoxygalactose transaminase